MKIFIIEDEIAIREELTQLLKKYGYECKASDDFQNIGEIALSFWMSPTVLGQKEVAIRP